MESEIPEFLLRFGVLLQIYIVTTSPIQIPTLPSMVLPVGLRPHSSHSLIRNSALRLSALLPSIAISFNLISLSPCHTLPLLMPTSRWLRHPPGSDSLLAAAHSVPLLLSAAVLPLLTLLRCHTESFSQPLPRPLRVPLNLLPGSVTGDTRPRTGTGLNQNQLALTVSPEVTLSPGPVPNPSWGPKRSKGTST